jgi:hypothetical protein
MLNFPRHVFSDINSNVGANNRYCYDNGPGVGSDERVSNTIMLGRKVRCFLTAITNTECGLSIYLSGLMIAVGVFRNPNAIEAWCLVF